MSNLFIHGGGRGFRSRTAVWGWDGEKGESFKKKKKRGRRTREGSGGVYLPKPTTGRYKKRNLVAVCEIKKREFLARKGTFREVVDAGEVGDRFCEEKKS